LFVCLLAYLSFAFVLRDFLVGNATAPVTRKRIYEATGGDGKELSRRIAHKHTVKRKEPQEATGVQI